MAYAQPELDKPVRAVKDRATRAEAAVGLRMAGATYADIARTLDYPSPSLARQAVERALAATVGKESRDQMRFLEARRLERLLRSLWPKATDAKDPEHLAAIRTAVTLIDRHARLYGLDAPVEVVVTPTVLEMEAWVSKMAGQMRGELPVEADIIEAEILAVEH